MIAVIYCGPSNEVYLPESGLTAARAVPLDAPDDVAGREAGPWRPALPGEVTPGGGWTPEGWPLHQADDGSWLTRDPGSGLLAQEGAWARPGSAEAAAAIVRELEQVRLWQEAGLPLTEAMTRFLASLPTETGAGQ